MMDAFDLQAGQLEDEFRIALADAYLRAENAIDLDALTAAIEAGNEEAIAEAMNLDIGSQLDLDHALNAGIAYALLGAIIIAMKRFATRHGSRVETNSEGSRLREEILRNIIDPLSRKAADAMTVTLKILQAEGMPSRLIAGAVQRSIGLAPDQAKSVAYFQKALYRALNSQDSKPTKNGVYASNETAKAILTATNIHLNAGQRSALKRALRQELTDKSVASAVTRHTQALKDFRLSTIARQEAARSIHAGEYLAFKQGKANRSLPRTARRHWVTRGDERVRHSHSMVPGMNTEGVDAGQAFQTPLGPVLFPPLEVNCRCRVVVRTPEQEAE